MKMLKFQAKELGFYFIGYRVKHNQNLALKRLLSRRNLEVMGGIRSRGRRVRQEYQWEWGEPRELVFHGASLFDNPWNSV